MDTECSAEDEPNTQQEKYFDLFSKAVDKKNEKLIDKLIKKEGVLKKFYPFSGNDSFIHLAAKRGTIATAIKICKLGSNVNFEGNYNETPIYHAIENSVEMVDTLIKIGANVNHVSLNNKTPMHHAIKRSAEMVDILLKNGADYKFMSSIGVTLLHEALLNGSAESVRLLLNKNLSEIQKNYREAKSSEQTVKKLLKNKEVLKIREKDYPLLIFFVSKIGKEDIFKLVLNEIGKSLIFEKDRTSKKSKLNSFDQIEGSVPYFAVELNYKGFFGRTALHYAVREQLPEVVRFLLKAGADANSKTKEGLTSLHYAVGLENEEICNILLNFKADVNPNSSEIGSPLYQVCGINRVLSHLKTDGGYYYPEYDASEYGEPALNSKIAKLLLQYGANPDVSEYKDEIPPLEVCISSDLEAAKILLQFGANLHVRNKRGNTALHYAAIVNCIEVFDFLLKAGLDIDTTNDDNYTPLLLIVKNNKSQKMIKYLINRGADVNFRGKKGETPIYYAVKHSAELVTLLLESGAKVNITGEKGVTILHEALLSGSAETIRLVLNKMLSENQNKETENSEEVMRIILENKKVLNIREMDYPILILFAAKTGNDDVFKVILSKVMEKLMSAEVRSSERSEEPFDQIQRYVAVAPAELNYQGYYDRTALHYAVREQQPVIVRFLLQAGADVNCRTRAGLSPLHYAVGLENAEICNILMSFGAEVNPDSPGLENLLFQVCGLCTIKGHLESNNGYYYEEYIEPECGMELFNPKITKLLLQNGANRSLPGFGGRTCFFQACYGGCLESLITFIEFGLSVRVRDENWNSALHYAVRGESPQRFAIVSFLLQKGLDINITNLEDYTPLTFIMQSGSPIRLKMIKYLVSRGAGVNFLNSKGESPMHYAIRNSPKLVKILLQNGAKVNFLYKNDVTLVHEALVSGTEETLRLVLNKIILEIQEGKRKKLKELRYSKEVVRLLLNNKAVLQIVRNDFPLLILFVAKIGDDDIFQQTLNDIRHSLVLAEDKDTSSSDSSESLEQVQRYVPIFPEALNCQGYYDRTALHYAIREQLPETVRYLLKKGADVNCKTRAGFTPLHYAACLQNQEICKILLSFGADVNLSSPGIGSPLFQVCGEHTAQFHLVSSKGYYYKELNKTDSLCIIFNQKLATLLLQNGANPDIPGAGGVTSFLELCQGGSLDPLKFLHQFGANLHVRDDRGFTALHYAAIGSSLELLDFLLEKGSDIDVKNFDNYSPFLQVMQKDRPILIDIIEYLVDHGADINARDDKDATGLHNASTYFESKDLVECLIELGADVKLKHRIFFRWSAGYPHFGCGRKTLIAFIALKEYELRDYINCYFVNVPYELPKAFQYFQECRLEMKKLKTRKIVQNSRVSFHDFLTVSFYNAVQISKNTEIRVVLKSREYYKEFMCYSFLLEKRFERVVTLSDAVDKTEFFLTNYLSRVPTLAIRYILNMLCSSDFRKFDFILSKRHCLVKEELDPNLEYSKIYKAKIVEIRENGIMVTLYPKMRPALLYNSQLDTSSFLHPGALNLKIGDKIPVRCMGRYPATGQLRMSGKDLKSTDT